MNLHEYQSKAILARYGIPVPRGALVRSAEEARTATQGLGAGPWIVKAQIHAGGRGKAGGIRRAQNSAEALSLTQTYLRQTLVTQQTGAAGLPVSAVWVEELTAMARELYLGAVIDRSVNKLVVMASTEGGVDIEETAVNHPQKILRVEVDPLLGLLPFQARSLGFQLSLNLTQIAQFSRLLEGLTKAFIENDFVLAEINPLVVTAEGKLVCLDAKIALDDNALFRHPELASLRDATQENPQERHARQFDLNYIALDGNIGCMVNGAGLAMATMDMIRLFGAMPANFLDVGGGTTTERVTEAFKLLVADPQVTAILVNIFGGIVRCDLIAEGIISAVKEVGVNVPVVVRLEGNNAKEGLARLRESKLNIITAADLGDAAQRVVAAVST